MRPGRWWPSLAARLRPALPLVLPTAAPAVVPSVHGREVSRPHCGIQQPPFMLLLDGAVWAMAALCTVPCGRW
jgi:hypothetical protein